MSVRGTYGANRPSDERRRLSGAQRHHAWHRKDRRQPVDGARRDLRVRGRVPGHDLQALSQDGTGRLQRHPHARRDHLGHEPHALQAPRHARGRRCGQGRRHEGDLSRAQARLSVYAGRKRLHQDGQPLARGGSLRHCPAQDHRQRHLGHRPYLWLHERGRDRHQVHRRHPHHREQPRTRLRDRDHGS